ncbi:MAG: SLBB domain-containing protein, partial [Bacteroidota bacterium]
GLSAREADLYLTSLFSKFLKDPIVYLRVLSLEVTVIGEVNNPANYQLDKEPFSLVELIGEAGGFTDYADVSKIRILRTHPDGSLEEIYYDLTDRDVLFVKDLSLRSRDVIYIPERRAKQFEKTVSGKIAPLVGVLGSIALIMSIINSLQSG